MSEELDKIVDELRSLLENGVFDEAIEIIQKKKEAYENEDLDGQTVDPWTVQGGKDGVDYDKLVEQFGCQLIDDELLKRFETVTGKKPHIWLRRGYFYSHRDINKLLDAYEKGQPFYLYTGRGPSGGIHFGHLVPFLFTKWLQNVFNVPLVIQMTDDEKFLWKDLTQEQAAIYLRDNIKDIIALGFDASKTFIFSDYNYMGTIYPIISAIQKKVTLSQVKGIFGFKNNYNIGQVAFPATQAAPSFPGSFPVALRGDSNLRCLIPCAIDQDPYFRMTRDISESLGFHKPALLLSKFFPALQGSSSKMSSSNKNSAIFITDTRKEIEDKIIKHAFSGGQDSMGNHRTFGAINNLDVPIQYLEFFLDDDDYLEEIKMKYKCGIMMTSELKRILIDILVDRVEELKNIRETITDDMADVYLTERELDF